MQAVRLSFVIRYTIYMIRRIGVTLFLLITYYLSLITPAFADLGPAPAGAAQLQDLFLRILNISVALAFFALLIVLIYAGFRYLTSGGDAKSLAGASQAITWALLGVLFLALAWLALKLIEIFTGVKVTDFQI